MDATLWRITATPIGPTWSGLAAVWHATRLSPGIYAEPGVSGAGATVVVAIELPVGFHAEEIVVDGRRVRISLSPALVDAAWVSPVPVYEDFRPLLEAARADELNPMLRWRARLLRAGVPDDPSRPPVELDDPLLESWAVQEELRWRAGLSRLHAADADLCARVRARLLGRVESAESRLVVPLWSEDGRALGQLEDVLLDQRISGAGLAQRAAAWLRRQPDGVGWFEQVFADGAPGSTYGFVRAWAGNASDRPALAWIEFRAERQIGAPVPEPRVLRPGELALLEAPVRLGAGEPVSVSAEIHVGGRIERGEVVIGSLPATPPGVVLGPLLAAHDAASLTGGDGGRGAMEGGSCVGLLRRLDSIGSAPSDVAARGRWSVLLECGRTADPGTITLDFAHENGRTVVSVGGDGAVAVGAPDGLPVAGYPRVVPVVVDGTTWRADVPVPDWCVGHDGRLRVALVRRGRAGGVWSWPSRVLRLEPERGGHAVVDLQSWDRGGARADGG